MLKSLTGLLTKFDDEDDERIGISYVMLLETEPTCEHAVIFRHRDIRSPDDNFDSTLVSENQRVRSKIEKPQEVTDVNVWREKAAPKIVTLDDPDPAKLLLRGKLIIGRSDENPDEREPVIHPDETKTLEELNRAREVMP